MKNRHRFNRERKRKRTAFDRWVDDRINSDRQFGDMLEAEIESLRQARQNWQEWERFNNQPWSKVIH